MITTLMLLAAMAAPKCPTAADFPPPGTCHFGPHGEPDDTCTPGETDDTLTVVDLCTTSTKERRCDLSPSAKRAEFAAYGLVWKPGVDYEDDHRISLTLAGTDGAKNRWPQAAKPLPGFHQKDLVEDRLHIDVCKGEISLAAAQQIVATGWIQFYNGMPKKAKHGHAQ